MHDGKRVDELPAVLSIEEAADFLRINHKTLRTAIKRHQVPGVIKVGRIYRVGRDALIRWAGCEPPAQSENR